jgi:hypothetical protein
MPAMRSALVLCLIAWAAGAEDLRQREAAGWEGFGEGSWVKLKTIVHTKGKVAISISTTHLKKIGTKTLELGTVVKNAFGEETPSSQKIPRKGEAGVDEKQIVEGLPKQKVTAVKRTFDCSVRRITVTGPHGKRVITIWEAAEPQVLVKRTIRSFDPKGKLFKDESWTLKSLKENFTVMRQAVPCVVYTTVAEIGGARYDGVLYLSRTIPGSTVRAELKSTREGQQQAITTVYELLQYERK